MKSELDKSIEETAECFKGLMAERELMKPIYEKVQRDGYLNFISYYFKDKTIGDSKP